MNDGVAIAVHCALLGSAVFLEFDRVVIAVLGVLAGFAVGNAAVRLRDSANAGGIARTR